MTPNTRKRTAGLTEGDQSDPANRRRGGSGRFQRSTPCDFCGKSCAAEHFTDDRACGGGDGPGFYLCGRANCKSARTRLEAEQGFGALNQHYAEQRRKNDLIEREGFLDGPPGTKRELTALRRQQTAVAQMLRYATDPEKIISLQAKERDLQERVDRLAFPEEHRPNGGYYVWLVKPNGVPVASEGPYGPHPLTEAKQLARIGATNGEHDRAVTLGRDPGSNSFKIVRLYRRRTGERVL